MKTVYLDNAATTFPKPPEVIEAVNECISEYLVNPHRGSHYLVMRADERIHTCRALLAKEFHVSPSRVVFVPSATYGINLVIRGLNMRSTDNVYVSPFEHNAVYRCIEHWRQEVGLRLHLLPISSEGHVDLDQLKAQFESYPPTLVAVVHASNVTGQILPVEEITKLSREYEALVLVDAAQTVGLYHHLLRTVDYDFLVFSSHKGLYGIPGSGAVVFRSEGYRLVEPLVHGGTGSRSEDPAMPKELPDRFEAGTQNLSAIVSMFSGLRWMHSIGVDTVRAKVNSLTALIRDELKKIDEIVLIGPECGENVGIVSFVTKGGMSLQQLTRVLESRGFCVRAGLHCAPLAHRTLGTFPEGTIRVSPSYFSSEEDIRCLVDLLDMVFN